MDPFLGQIMLVPYSFAPKGWAFCQGQLMPISQNTALFSLLGTLYGGDGRSTFALPNLIGRMPVCADGNTFYQGSTGGVTDVQLALMEMAGHNHLQGANAATGTTASPVGATFGQIAARGQSVPYFVAAGSGALMASCVGPAGSSQTHTNMMPYLVMNYIIALQGIFPSRQ